jgi:hypothetical protein
LNIKKSNRKAQRSDPIQTYHKIKKIRAWFGGVIPAPREVEIAGENVSKTLSQKQAGCGGAYL